jgi:hypothetical protein
MRASIQFGRNDCEQHTLNCNEPLGLKYRMNFTITSLKSQYYYVLYGMFSANNFTKIV